MTDTETAAEQPHLSQGTIETLRRLRTDAQDLGYGWGLVEREEVSAIGEPPSAPFIRKLIAAELAQRDSRGRLLVRLTA